MAYRAHNWGGGDPAAAYAHGLALGAEISNRQKQIQAERERTMIEAETRQQAQDLDFRTAQQRIKVQEAYQVAQLEIQKQKLADAQKVNEQRTKDAALKFADQQALNEDLAKGMPLEQALYRHPRVASPQLIEGAQRIGEEKAYHKSEEQRAADALQLAKDREARLNQPPKPKALPPGTVHIPENALAEGSPDMRVPLGSPQANAYFKAKGMDETGQPLPQPPAAPAGPGMFSRMATGAMAAVGDPVLGPVGGAIQGLFGGGKTAAPAGPAQPKTQEEFDALAPGTPFVNPKDGKVYTKKDKAAPAKAPEQTPEDTSQAAPVKGESMAQEEEPEEEPEEKTEEA